MAEEGVSPENNLKAIARYSCGGMKERANQAPEGKKRGKFFRGGNSGGGPDLSKGKKPVQGISRDRKTYRNR